MKHVKVLVLSLSMLGLSLGAMANDMAQTHELPGDAVALTPISGEVVSVEPICPANPGGISCMAIGSRVSLNFTLMGCADELVVLGTDVQREYDVRGEFTQKVILTVSAVNVHRKASQSMLCFAAPRVNHSVYIPEEAVDVEVKFLGVQK